MEANDRHKLQERWGALKTERSSWMAHYKEISNFLLQNNNLLF